MGSRKIIQYEAIEWPKRGLRVGMNLDELEKFFADLRSVTGMGGTTVMKVD